MNVWHGVAVTGSVLVVESLANLLVRREIKGNLLRLASAGVILLLALVSFSFHLFGADIVVETSNIWFLVGSTGFTLFLEGASSFLINRAASLETRGDVIRTNTGLAIFAVALALLIITGG